MEKISLAIYKFSKLLLIALTAMLSIVIISQVISRSFLGFSFVWSEEVGRYLLIWLTFIGASTALRDDELIGLDLLDSRLNFRNKKLIKLLIHISILFFLLFVAYYGTKTVFSPGILNQTASTFEFSMAYVYLAIPVATLIMIIHIVTAIQKNIKDVRRYKDC
ncbi:TRAP transporter small permease [Alteribacillus sp. YIM 98480]|uniref:TRAP transporter small permease n=1 Tax=Alteribacillus sp. YIM 98480 TaxID=2606599 RepID=UPI00131ACDDB|nr:TRAP transporter small permease [Alteribacillus sp. YIM 98480]